jgi:hypothetical protein
MIEIKVSQIWGSRNGTKNGKQKIKIINRLNSKCWLVEHSSNLNTQIMNDQQIREEYVLSKT